MVLYNVEEGVAIISWNMEGYTMNVLNEDSIKAFADAVEKAVGDEAVKGIIITSEKETFGAGADLKMIKSMLNQQNLDVKTAFENARQLNQLFRSYETSGKPVVAGINGTALGGFYEVCLACHYRVAVNNPKSKIGLPESQVGLIPGAGGTQRVPRMVGIEAAAPLLLEGKTLSPERALKAGLVDEVVADKAQMMAAAKKFIAENKFIMQPWDEKNRKGQIVGKKNFRVPKGNIQSPKGVQVLMPGTALLMDKTKGNYPAQLAIMSCVYEGLQVPMDQALDIESRHFTRILRTPEAKGMVRTLFFGKQAADKGEARPKDVPKYDIKTVAVLGAGMMGAGIAYVSAMAGMKVVLKDISVENAEKGKDYSRNLLKKRVSKKRMTQEKADAVLELIHPTADYADLAEADYVIEAVFENRDLKYKVTQEVEAVIREDVIFGSNTSTLPITGLAEASKRPDQFIGIHFFSPVDKMMLVEVIMGEKSSDKALAATLDYIQKIKKTPIVVNDSRGFYTSRCFSTYTAEGMEMLQEGINPILIENAGKAAGMPVGPLDVADAVALDLAYKIMKQTSKDLGQPMEDMPGGKVVIKFNEELDRVGKKAKKGFYAYPENGKKYLWEGLQEHYPLAENQPDIETLKKRFLHRQAMECIRCLEEGVLRNPTDGDIGSIFAWGFAPFTGGAFSYVDAVGIAQFVKDCDEFEAQFGERFKVSDKLRAMAANGESFFKEEAVEAAAV
ncbi:3-hydroxyacyl-CoA dehydrogenase [marine bacterium AO1-C]|nr:3-hydroxyacyl-CoA dehydrogenase [marine bacterium AO1-C]